MHRSSRGREKEHERIDNFKDKYCFALSDTGVSNSFVVPGSQNTLKSLKIRAVTSFKPVPEEMQQNSKMHKTQSAATTAATMTHRMKQIADKEIISRPYRDNYFNCSLSEPIMYIKCVANNCLGQTSTCETEPTNTKVKIKGDSSKQFSPKKRLKVEGKGLEGSSSDEKDSNVDYGAELLSREEEMDETYILTNPTTTTSGQNDPAQKQGHDVDPNESNKSEDDRQYAYPHATQGLPTELSRQVGQGFAGFQVHPHEDVAKGRHQSQLSEYRESKHCLPPTRPYNDEASKPSCNPYKNSTVYDFQYDASSALKVSDYSSCSVSNKDPLTLTNPGLRVNKEMPPVPRISDVLFERLQPMPHFSPEFNKVEISPFTPCRRMDGVVDSARTAVMRSEMWRLSTFSKLPTLPVSAVRLAQSGFYYDEELDEILCYSCGLKKKQWNKSEKVAIVHLAMSPECHHANCKDERNIAETQYPYSPRETECSQNGSSNGENNTVTDGDSAVDPSPTLPRNDTAPTLGDRNVLAPTPAPTQIHTPISAGLNQDGRSLALPPPAGRTEQLQRHRQMAAQSAGTARPRETGSSSLIETSVAVPTTNELTGKQRIGVHNTEAVHTGKDSALPLQNHFKSSPEVPSVQVYHANFQSPPAVPATTLVNYSVQVVQAPDANPFQRGSSNAYRHNEGNEDGTGEVPGNGLLDMRRAASPDNALVSVRLATFLDWPTRGLPNRRLLVIAGFYYMGTGDSVRCFYCGVTLRNWRENDDPWVTHVRFRFSCDYVKAIKGEDFVYRALLEVALGHTISSETGCITSSESAAVTNGIDNSSTSCGSQQTSPTSIANTTSAYAAISTAATDNAPAASGTAVPSTAARSSTTVGMSKEAPRGPGSCSTTEQGTDNFMNAEGNRSQATLRSRDASEGASSSSTTSSTGNGPETTGTGKKGNGNQKGGASKAAVNNDGASVGTYAQNGAEVLQTDAEPDKHRSTATLPQTNQQTVAVGGQSLNLQSTVSTEYPTVPNTGVAGNHGNATSFQQLQETNHRLRRRVTCRLCGNRPVDTIFLPCGHLCTCEMCAATIRMCCLCNDRIRGTAHVYME